MEEANTAHEEELKEKRHRNWIKADVHCIKYLSEGLVQFVDEVVKKQHEEIMKEYNGRKCTRCTLPSLRPNHRNLFRSQSCPLNHDGCICLDKTRNRFHCRSNICGSIYDKIIKLYFFNPPTPCWKNTDVKKWCEDPWAIAKCFISFPGYWSKSGPSEIDCTGLLHILINNKGLHRHLECPISHKGIDVFCPVRRTREDVIRNTKQELDDKELEDYINDIIELLEDKRELLYRKESKEAVEKLLKLKRNDLVIPPMKSAESRRFSRAESDRGSLDLAESGISKSVETQPSYSSKYESEFVHKRVLGSGAFGVVFEAENNVDKLSYAVKRITLRKSNTLQDTVSREVRALAKLEHPNIVRYFHAWTETPPPGWQEQKDQQRGISESQNTLSSSNTTSMVSSASRVDVGLPSSNAKSQNRDGYNDKKGLTDLFLDPFGQTLYSQTDAYSRRESSDSWESNNRSTSDESNESEKTEETSTEDIPVDLMDNSRSTVKIPSSPHKKYLGTSQHDQQNPIRDNRNKQIGKSSNVLSLNKDKNKNKLFFYIQMQLCKPETLAQWLEENTLDTSREMQKVLVWFEQILSAVRYMHEQEFLHRDLKPSNIFFSAKNVVKVGDFGFATALEEDQDFEIYSEAGTYLYMAPEVLNKCGRKSNKVDIYSLGVILFELLYSFHTQNERTKTLEEIRNLRFPENFTREMPEKERLVSKMLSPNPEERPTAKEILNEILFTEMPKRARRETM